MPSILIDSSQTPHQTVLLHYQLVLLLYFQISALEASKEDQYQSLPPIAYINFLHSVCVEVVDEDT